jgi:hypothetical protein
VPLALPGFHDRLLRDHALALACPKLDGVKSYVEKLEAMIDFSQLAEIRVARMEVPCCGGLLQAAHEARRRAARDVRVTEVVVSLRGETLHEREIPAAVAAGGSGAPFPTPCCHSRS